MKKPTAFFAPVLFACVVLSLTSCKDDEDMTPPHETLLMSHSWKFTGLSMDTDDEIMLAFIESMQSIVANHTITFNKNKTFTHSLDPSFNGTWSMSADGKTLTMKDNSSDSEMKVIKLDENNLVLGDYDEYYGADLVSTYVKN